MTHASVCSGIGGAELAAEWARWENIFHCEKNPFGSKILDYYWPKSKSYEDLTTTDFRLWRGKVDVFTAGFPCQPFSSAGKRKGTEDDRHLWPHVIRAIREIQPRYIVGENVRGFTNWNGGMVFDQVQSDLEAEGYEVLPFLLPACGVNAPHRRDRIWIVAYSTSNRRERERQGIKNENGQQGSEHSRIMAGRFEGLCNVGNVADTTSAGLEVTRNNREYKKEKITGTRDVSGNQYVADTNGFGLRGSFDGNGETRFFDQASEANYWQNFPTQSPVCSGDDGLPTELDGITFSKWRNESIKGFGNAWVPELAYQIFNAINEIELLNN